ncbi:MFS family permease [Paracidovorax wautersii]|uniref:MFS family permease n=2 Tax=Paracidovorax wautersii TaxID=1177982 RepID=A0ABU1IFA6_9BURK|nr:MFS family permease [Paracidovorax wautersii]
MAALRRGTITAMLHPSSPPALPAPRFHGTAVVHAAFVIALFGWGVGFYGPPIFLYAVAARTGWPLALVSAAVTLHFLWGAAVVACLPRLHARWGLPAVTVAGTAALALGVAGWAHAQQPWQLAAAALLSGGGWVTIGAAGINAMVSPWFVQHRVAALSRAYNGASIGGMVFSPLWGALIARWGFATAAWVVGACMVLTIAVLARRVLAPTPAALGQQADGSGAPAAPAARRAAAPAAVWAPLAGRALWAERRFQTLAAAMALGLFAQIGLVAHLYTLLVPHLGPQGAGWAMALATACALGGRALAARCLRSVGDRRAVACISYGVQMAGSLVLLAAPGDGPALWLGLVLFGAGIGNATSLPPLVAQTDFAAQDVARVVALIVALSQALYALAPMAFALLLGASTGTAPFFAAAALLQLIALVLLWSGRTKGMDV